MRKPFSIGCLLIICVFALFGLSNILNKKMWKVLPNGEHGRLVSAQNEPTVFMGERLEDLAKLYATNKPDKQLIAGLISSNRIRPIPVGTPVEVLDSHMRFGKVRFRSGQEGWVLFTEILPDKQN